MGSVRVAIVGVGNCASSLVQGVEYYRDADPASRVRWTRFNRRLAAEHGKPWGLGSLGPEFANYDPAARVFNPESHISGEWLRVPDHEPRAPDRRCPWQCGRDKSD